MRILSCAFIGHATTWVVTATGEYRTQLGATAAPRVETGEHWDLTDELVSVRDRIVSLEAALADTEIKLTQLHARHDSLQSQHADLLIHSQAVSRDRDRLAEESLLWLASRQQLQDQLEQQRVETSTTLLNLQQSLEQQQRTGGELHRQLTEQRAQAEQLRQQHARQISDLTRQLEKATAAWRSAAHGVADCAAAVRRAACLGCCTGAQHGAGPARKGRSGALPGGS